MKILVWDVGGMSTSTAHALLKEGHEVYYFIPYFSPYPKFVDFASGTGTGLIKVLDPGKYYDEMDLIVFPDVGAGDTAQFLRDKGYPVFGAGKGEIMEQDRGLSAEIMDQFGIPHPEITVVKGIEEAMKFLFNEKTETNQLADGQYFVKFNVFRGSMESFPADNYEQTKEMFAKVRSSYGPYADELPITINKKVEGTETGADLFFNGTEFITPCMWGFESGSDYVGYIDSDLPEFQKDYLGKVAEYLKSVNYRGALSTEVIYNGKECSLIDWTCRFPLPLGLMYSQFIPNFGEFLLSIAMGETPKTNLPEGKYIGIASIISENAIEDWLPVKANEFTKLMRYIEVNGQDFIVPGISTLGCVVGEGSSFKEFNENLSANCEGVEAFFASLNPEFLADIIYKYLDPLKKYGIEFGPNSKLEKRSVSNSRAGQFISFLLENLL